jgi:hypothetical protein
VYEQRAILAAIRLDHAMRAAEVLLELRDQGGEVDRLTVDVLRRQLHPRAIWRTIRDEMPDVHLADTSRRIGRDRGHRVEAKQREVREVVSRELLATQVRVHEAQTAKASLAAAHATDVGQHDLRRISDKHVLDRAAPVDEDADLAVNFGGLRRELCGELGRHDLRRGHAPAVQALQCFQLAGSQTREVSRHFLLQWSSVSSMVRFSRSGGLYPTVRALHTWTFVGQPTVEGAIERLPATDIVQT